MPEEPYQVMPEHAPESYEALKTDIRNRGFKDPITVDERGKILDGHTRVKIFEELSEEGEEIAYPSRRVAKSLSDDVEKRTLARKQNALRRQLTSAQKKEIGQEQLKDTPRWSNDRIAEVVGVHVTSVRGWRVELEDSGKIPYYDQLEMHGGHLTHSREQLKAKLSGAAKEKHDAKIKKEKEKSEGLHDGHAGPAAQTVEEAFTSGVIPGNEPLPAPTLSEAQKAFYDLKKWCNLFLPVDPEEVAAECTDPDDAKARMEEAARAIEWFTDFSEALASTARREMTALSGGKEG